jgi:uncharacterized protein YbjT (DUF2867 family)
MSRRVLVTGATGTLGRALVPQLIAAGHDVRALSRRPRDLEDGATWFVGDLLAGTGLGPAVVGVDAVVHCASDPKSDQDVGLNLLHALRRTGGTGTHVVYISIVGIDRIPYGYYNRKLAVEHILEASHQPYTTLRTTQFHELILGVLRAQRRLPLTAVPKGLSFQPIDVNAVAAHLAEYVAATPAGRVEDLGGPEVLSVREIAELYAQVTHRRRRPVTPIPLPGPVGAALRAGANLCEQRDTEGRTFSEFLSQTIT